jgi:cystathionine beta-lyase
VSTTKDPYGGSSPPLYQTATFAFEDGGEYDYTRSGNPTRTQLESVMADLEGATRSFAFTSGMGALAVAMRLVPSGGHIVTGDDIYGGTSRLLSRVAPDQGITVSNVDMCDLEAVRAAMRPETKLVWLESPTNPRMQVTDVAGVAAIARQHGALSIVDNSIMAPVLQQPLALGADISMTSATKFVAGHSDVTAGILSVRGDALAERVYFLQNSEGGGLAPFDCWLCLRGLKTMALRMERQQANCVAMAKWLQTQPLVTKIHYPGLPSDPGHALQMKQAKGGGSLLSFETGSVAASQAVLDETTLFKVTVSFGATNSLISLPCFMSHASIPREVRLARGLPDDLVRISAGIEDEADLIEDLSRAFAIAERAQEGA